MTTNCDNDIGNRLLLSISGSAREQADIQLRSLMFTIYLKFTELEQTTGYEKNGYFIDADLERDYTDSNLFLHYLLAPLILCDHSFYHFQNSYQINPNNDKYLHGHKVYEDLLLRGNSITKDVQHEQYLDYLFWKVFVPLKGKDDIFPNRFVPYHIDLPRNQEDHNEFIQYYLPSINETARSDFEEILLAIRKKKYAVTLKDYFDIVEPIIEGRKHKQIYLKFLFERQKQKRHDRRMKRSLGDLLSTSPEMLMQTIEEIFGDTPPVYNLRNRVVQRDDVKMR